MKSPEQAAFKVILIVAVLIAIAVLPFFARADSHHQGPPGFADFDSNGDGFVSEEEFNTLRSERIAARAAEGRQMKGLASAPPFSDIDSNGDGKLDEAEFTAGRDAHMKDMQKKRGGHGGGQGMAYGQGHGHRQGMKMPAFADLDLDGNGCIDADEFAKHQASHHGQGQKQKQP